MVDATFVNAVTDNARRSVPQIMGVPPALNKCVLWNPAAGRYEEHAIPPAPYSMAAGDVQSFALAMEHYSGDGAAVWISLPENRGELIVRGYFDAARQNEERRGAVALALQLTPEAKCIASGLSGGPAELLRDIGKMRDGTFPDSFLRTLAAFKFSSGSETAGENRSGREALSRSVVKEASFGGAPPPDRVTANVLLLAAAGLDPALYAVPSCNIEMSVAVDYDACELDLATVYGQFEAAVRTTAVAVRTAIQAAFTANIPPIFFGDRLV